MSKHEYYEQLSTLAAIGQITPEEDKELSSHLAECAECREAHADFGRILQHELPQAAPRRRWLTKSPSPVPDNEVRDRFFARARAAGINLSPQAQQRPPRSPISRWATFRWQYAAVAALVLIFIGVGVMASRKPATVLFQPPITNLQVDRLTKEKVVLNTQLTAAHQVIDLNSAELTRLKQEKAASKDSMRALENEVEQAKQEVAQLAATLQQARMQSADLSGRRQQDQTVIADLHSQLEAQRRVRDDDEKSSSDQQARIAELEGSLRAASEKYERERQLFAVSRDVRLLMATRNLHIIDVHDVSGDGRSTKPFGRVFYADGQSLIFYAFDLPNRKFSPGEYSFMAWGQNEATPQSPRRLGTFEVDDHNQRRWVLKVDDAKLLTGIDSVFVTAERHGDAFPPHGNKILYAYLAGRPNHP